MVKTTRPCDIRYRCSCLKKRSIEQMYFCETCSAIKCPSCMAPDEIECYFCPNCLETTASGEAMFQKHKCKKCFSCPACQAILSIVTGAIEPFLSKKEESTLKIASIFGNSQGLIPSTSSLDPGGSSIVGAQSPLASFVASSSFSLRSPSSKLLSPSSSSSIQSVLHSPSLNSSEAVTPQPTHQPFYFSCGFCHWNSVRWIRMWDSSSLNLQNQAHFWEASSSSMTPSSFLLEEFQQNPFALEQASSDPTGDGDSNSSLISSKIIARSALHMCFLAEIEQRQKLEHHERQKLNRSQLLSPSNFSIKKFHKHSHSLSSSKLLTFPPVDIDRVNRPSNSESSVAGSTSFLGGRDDSIQELERNLAEKASRCFGFSRSKPFTAAEEWKKENWPIIHSDLRKVPSIIQVESSLVNSLASSVNELVPSRVCLSIKRSKRCGSCERFLIKPDLNLSKSSMQRKHVALRFIPNITLLDVAQAPIKADSNNTLYLAVRSHIPSDVKIIIKNPRGKEEHSDDTLHIYWNEDHLISTGLQSAEDLVDETGGEMSPEVKQLISKDNPRMILNRSKLGFQLAVPIRIPASSKGREAKITLEVAVSYLLPTSSQDFSFSTELKLAEKIV